MGDSPDVEQTELMEMIAELEEACASLSHDDARVLVLRKKLQRLKFAAVKKQSPSEVSALWKIAIDLLKAIAVEVIRHLTSTRNCFLTAIRTRSFSYEDWRMYQIAKGFSWLDAERAR